ncbi:MAG: Hsp33 family molecular chaperone HslO [Halothiobacillaceae bacterium]|nr:MAG: Hsp33 family molecular chaperone HslO [Halothiobacillaceae bacterium]
MSQRDFLHRFIFTHAEDEFAVGVTPGSYAGGPIRRERIGDHRKASPQDAAQVRVAPARGELVQLDAAWQALLSRSDYPPAVAELLGQAAVAAVLLAATLKIDGKLTLQVMTDKPAETDASRPGGVHLLVMQVSSDRELRGLARWHGDVSENGLALMGDGRLVMTIETARGERYQGIVPLEGASLAQALEGYFERSEQLPTRLWLEAGPQRAAGLLVQKMPGHDSGRDDEDWNRIVALSGTVTRDELLDLSAETLLHRLYHEEDRRVFEPEAVRFACSCSRERVADMLRSLGRDEIDGIIAEQGHVEVDCEFCNARYTFDAVDAAGLFVDAPHPGAEGLH